MADDTPQKLGAKDKPTFREWRFRLGVVVSVAWVLAMLALVYLQRSKISTLDINQWGDFFAGAFAPLAFLWLVLGYLQQGEELRLSTRALHIQADELQKSAEQQRQLVEVTRQQVESEREAIEFERRQKEMELSPIIDVRGTGGSMGGNTTYGIALVNTGFIALALEVWVLERDHEPKLILSQASLERGATARTRYELGQSALRDSTRLELTYRDVGNTLRTISYDLFVDEAKAAGTLQFRRTGHSYRKAPTPDSAQ